MMFELTNMSKAVFTLGTLVEVADGIGDREHLGYLEPIQEAHPLLRYGSSDHKIDQRSLNSTMTGVSNRRDLQVKVNLSTFKDEKSKDVVTYHSWQWDVAIFC